MGCAGACVLGSVRRNFWAQRPVRAPAMKRAANFLKYAANFLKYKEAKKVYYLIVPGELGLRAGNEVPQRRALRAAAIRLLKGKQRPLGNRLRVSAKSQPERRVLRSLRHHRALGGIACGLERQEYGATSRPVWGVRGHFIQSWGSYETRRYTCLDCRGVDSWHCVRSGCTGSGPAVRRLG